MHLLNACIQLCMFYKATLVFKHVSNIYDVELFDVEFGTEFAAEVGVDLDIEFDVEFDVEFVEAVTVMKTSWTMRLTKSP